MHYINKNEDVIITLDENQVPESYYHIPALSTGYNYAIINFNDLFTLAECFAKMNDVDKGLPTIGMKMAAWMKQNKKNIPNIGGAQEYYWTGQRLIEEKYSKYDTLALSCLYGGNMRGFKILKPIHLTKEYIVSAHTNWDGAKIDKFISNLKKNGFIECPHIK